MQLLDYGLQNGQKFDGTTLCFKRDSMDTTGNHMFTDFEFPLRYSMIATNEYFLYMVQ